MVVITDASKEVAQLGKFKLPVEADLFGLAATVRQIEQAGRAHGCAGPILLRKTAKGERFLTDGGNAIFDCDFGAIPDADALAAALNAIPGVVEHGLFIGLATAVIIADPAGIRVLGRSPGLRRTVRRVLAPLLVAALRHGAARCAGTDARSRGPRLARLVVERSGLARSFRG